MNLFKISENSGKITSFSKVKDRWGLQMSCFIQPIVQRFTVFSDYHMLKPADLGKFLLKKTTKWYKIIKVVAE